MTSLYREPETPQLLQRIDSPIVGNGLVEREDISAGDSRTSSLPGLERRTAGPHTSELAAITPLRSADFDALATLPKSLRARWQQRYGNWLVASDVIVVSGVVAMAHILRFGNVTRGSLWAVRESVAYSAVSVSMLRTSTGTYLPRSDSATAPVMLLSLPLSVVVEESVDVWV